MTAPGPETLGDEGTAARYGLRPADVRRLQTAEFANEMAQATEGADDDTNYSYEDRVLRSAATPYQGAPQLERIVLPMAMRAGVIEKAHERGGHMSVLKTLHRVIEDFTWPGMRKDVRSYIEKCPICLAYKERRPHVAMQTMEIPRTPMQMVGMDLIGLFEEDPYGRKYIDRYLLSVGLGRGLPDGGRNGR